MPVTFNALNNYCIEQRVTYITFTTSCICYASQDSKMILEVAKMRRPGFELELSSCLMMVSICSTRLSMYESQDNSSLKKNTKELI